MSQLLHDVRVSYINTDTLSQSLQTCFNHSFNLDNPGKFTSGLLTLSGSQDYSIQGVNYIYVTSEKQFRIVINGENEIVGNHFSIINTNGIFNVLLENVECDEGEMLCEIKYFYGVLINESE